MEWYRLKLEGLKNSKIRILMDNFKNYSEIFENIKMIEKDLHFTSEEIRVIQNSKNNEKFFELTTYLEQNRIMLISMNDCRYPRNLNHISKQPLFLFYKGDINILNSEKIISVVGTRRNTKYGEMCCEKLVEGLVKNDVTIVSGLALGIDAIAHEKTLNKNGKTVAVLACGIDVFYPQTNIKLREKIEKFGLVISEFPMGTYPKPKIFPIRNRVVSGLSKGVVVVESNLKGGSMITANLALEEGRDVFAFPGCINYPLSKGCNELIKQSRAKLITCADDVLDEYNWKSEQSENTASNKLQGIKLKIYNVLIMKLHLEEIKKEISCDTTELLSNLMELELEGFIHSLPGGNYERKI